MRPFEELSAALYAAEHRKGPQGRRDMHQALKVASIQLAGRCSRCRTIVCGLTDLPVVEVARGSDTVRVWPSGPVKVICMSGPQRLNTPEDYRRPSIRASAADLIKPRSGKSRASKPFEHVLAIL